MTFIPLALADSDNHRQGFVIYRAGASKLHETSIYTADEVKARVAELNRDEALREVWPDANDPEVLALVNDPDFEPLEWIEEDVVADMDELVRLVDSGEVKLDPETQQVIEGGEKIRTEKDRVLKDPSQPMQRIRKATETIAERRLDG